MTAIKTEILYLIMGVLGCIFLRKSKIIEKQRNCAQLKYGNYLFLFWFFIWNIFISYRLVTYSFGGTDAPNYIKFFQNSLSQKEIIIGGESLTHHMGIVFSFFTKVIRSISNNYHVYFLCFYGFIVFSYILFINEFCLTDLCFVPMVLSFFPLVLSFNTMRTTFSVAMILCGVVLLNRRHNVFALIMFIASCSVHKASVIYFLFYPYYFFSKKHNKSIWNSFFYFLVMYGLGVVGQKILLSASLGILSATYIWYIGKSLHGSLFTWMPVVLFPQFLLFFCMILFRKELTQDMRNSLEKERLKILWLLCTFDIIIIPVCFIAGNFRGYEYFYLARIMMWGEILKIICRKMPRYLWYLVLYALILIFFSWFVFRIHSTWQAARLIPYKFAPFQFYAEEMNF